MTDQNGNTLPYFFGAVNVMVSGDIEPIGESPVMLRGGMGGLYIRTKGSVGRASVTLSAEGCESVTLGFNISAI
jgi:beta-galactosidase